MQFMGSFVRFVRLALVLFLVGVSFQSQSAFAQGKSILVIAPHPDDEALCCSGVIYSNVKAGNTVTVAVVTNGDSYVSPATTTAGYTREGETIAAMRGLGLSANNVIFLGYGDQSLQQLLYSASPTQVYNSAAGQAVTYANTGLGGVSYHQYLTGSAGSYNQATILADFESLLKNYAPTDIYTTGFWDDHPDHRATYAFTAQALIALKQQGLLTTTRIHETWIHAPCEYCDPSYTWPEPVFSPTQPFPEPEDISVTPYQWTQIENIPVPVAMQDPNQSTNLKWSTIAQYHTQTQDDPTSYLFGFVKIGEFFWIRNFQTNVAVLATATASSQTTTGLQGASNAIDGIISGIPNPLENALNYSSFAPSGGGEWVAPGQLAGAWIKLTWPSSVTTSQVLLYGRPDGVDNVLSGTLTFSDGSSVAVGALPVGGAGYPISFASKTITWMQFTVNSAQGTNIGLSEIEVIGTLTSSTNTFGPQMTNGPVATPTAIAGNQTATLTASAFDTYGYPLTYGWTVNGGSITGSGPNVVYNPPAAAGTYTGTVTVSDGHGGTTQNSGFITVCSSAANPAGSQSLFTTQTPALTGKSDGENLELGMLFQSDTAGQITGIRFWKDSNETGTHTGSIWSSTGTRLASVTFCNETASGWQVQSLASPLPITPNTNYVVSVNTGDTYYVDTIGGLASNITNADLSSVVTTNNGVYGNVATFPANSYSNSNYFRDVVFLSAANARYGISGTITGAGAATLTLSSNGVTVATLTSGVSGSTYTFTSVANGTYTVTPTLAGYTFSPPSASVTVNGANTSVSAITATKTHTVSGTVTGVAGATVTLSSGGSTVATLTTGASGSTYTFGSVANGTYTVTPTLAGYNFNSSSATVTVNGANATVSAFSATAKTYSVSGTITAAFMAIVTLSSKGNIVAELIVGPFSNAYTFSNVPNGNYIVTPIPFGYRFTPSSASITVNGANTSAPTFSALP
jgi:LmbE family N-acetylglucosaminyl deacetylase